MCINKCYYKNLNHFFYAYAKSLKLDWVTLNASTLNSSKFYYSIDALFSSNFYFSYNYSFNSFILFYASSKFPPLFAKFYAYLIYSSIFFFSSSAF